jgi:hypothetical protein
VAQPMRCRSRRRHQASRSKWQKALLRKATAKTPGGKFRLDAGRARLPCGSKARSIPLSDTGRLLIVERESRRVCAPNGDSDRHVTTKSSRGRLPVGLCSLDGYNKSNSKALPAFKWIWRRSGPDGRPGHRARVLLLAAPSCYSRLVKVGAPLHCSTSALHCSLAPQTTIRRFE